MSKKTFQRSYGYSVDFLSKPPDFLGVVERSRSIPCAVGSDRSRRRILSVQNCFTKSQEKDGFKTDTKPESRNSKRSPKRTFRFVSFFVGMLVRWHKLHVVHNLTSRRYAQQFKDIDSALSLAAVGTQGHPRPGVDTSEVPFFDPADFKAFKQTRMTAEAKRILTLPSTERTEQDIKYATVALRGIKVISEFPLRMQRELAKYGDMEIFEPTRTLVKQGQRPSAFYFILYGTVLVSVYNPDTGAAVTKCYLHKGDCFGELAILNSTKRQSTVLAKSEVEMLSISSEIYQTLFMSGGSRNINDPDHCCFIRKLSFLRDWPVHLMDQPTTKVIFLYFRRGVVLVKDSNFSDWIYVVKSGSVQVLKKLVRREATISAVSGKPLVTPSRERSPHLMVEAMADPSFWEDEETEFPITKPRAHTSDGRARPDLHISTVLNSNIPLTPWAQSSREQSRPVAHTALSHRRARSAFPSRPRGRRLGISKPKDPDLIRDDVGDNKVQDERRTYVDDLDAGFKRRQHWLTDADRDPVFVHISTLSKGDVFGLNEMLFDRQPSLCLVSNGAECLMIKKPFYLENCSAEGLRTLKTDMSPYPSDNTLQDNLLQELNWEAYKKATVTEIKNSSGRGRSLKIKCPRL